MGRWRWSYETRLLVRRAAGGVLLLAGAVVALRYLPGWLWLVAGGTAAAWAGYRLLRDE